MWYNGEYFCKVIHQRHQGPTSIYKINFYNFYCLRSSVYIHLYKRNIFLNKIIIKVFIFDLIKIFIFDLIKIFIFDLIKKVLKPFALF